MAEILLNSTVVVLVASAFVTTAIAALRNQDRTLQKVPVRIRSRRHPTTDR